MEAATPEAEAPRSSDAIVSCRGLSRRFGEGEAAVDALRDVDLDFPRGELNAIVGPSGSGKSTLMHLLAGLDAPTAGRSWVDGVEVTGLSDKDMTELRREKLGFIFQFFNLVPVLDAEENIALPLRIAGTEPRSRVDRRSCSRWSASPTVARTVRPSSPAVSSSASRSPGRWPRGRP